MKKFLRIVKRIVNRLFGTKSDMLFWRFRHTLDSKWPESYLSEISLNHLHRKILVDVIVKYRPKSVLEIGCASGPNLVLLSQKLPNVKLKGIDVSAKAIETGQKYLESKNVKNVKLNIGNVLNLKNFPDKSFDVVFTDATLIYVDKNKIENVLKELTRITRKAVILTEWNIESYESHYIGHWAHNYKKIFKEIAPGAEIKLTKINPEIWPGDWAKYGYIIECKIRI